MTMKGGNEVAAGMTMETINCPCGVELLFMVGEVKTSAAELAAAAKMRRLLSGKVQLLSYAMFALLALSRHLFPGQMRHCHGNPRYDAEI